jgi:hypothetical protein
LNKSLPASHHAFGRQQDYCVNAFLKRGREMISVGDAGLSHISTSSI